MAFQPTDDVVSAEFRYTWQGQQCENVEHFFKADFTAADMADLAEALYGAWYTNLADITSSTVLLREVFVTDLRTEDGATAGYASNPPVGGNNVNESVSNNTTLCLSLRTGGRGRSRRGRLYIVGLTENVVSDNRVSVAARNAWNAGWAALLDPDNTAGFQWCVLSRRNEGVLRPVAVGATITQVLFVDDVVDSQRRRLPGRGR